MTSSASSQLLHSPCFPLVHWCIENRSVGKLHYDGDDEEGVDDDKEGDGDDKDDDEGQDRP